MATAKSTTYQVDQTLEMLRKLIELSPQKKEMALIAFNFFIDGMNAQERLAAQANAPSST